MFKKLLLSVFLCISVLALLGTNAHAYPAVPGGWGVNVGSVCVWTDWKSVANADISPTDVTVWLLIERVKLHYINPGGQPGGDGVPFYTNVAIPIEGDLDDYASKNGRYQMNLCFDNDLLYQYIVNSGTEIPLPPNPQWTLDPENGVIVLEMYVTIRGFSSLDGDLIAEKETAHIAGPCTLPDEGSAYTCETVEDWVWDKKNPDDECPYENP